MWQTIKDKLSYLKVRIADRWGRFEDWIAGWLPGAKTKLVALLGVLGSLAFTMQGALAGVPTEKLVGPVAYGILTAVLFLLVFFFRGLGDRVEDRTV